MARGIIDETLYFQLKTLKKYNRIYRNILYTEIYLIYLILFLLKWYNFI